MLNDVLSEMDELIDGLELMAKQLDDALEAHAALMSRYALRLVAAIKDAGMLDKRIGNYIVSMCVEGDCYCRIVERGNSIPLLIPVDNGMAMWRWQTITNCAAAFKTAMQAREAREAEGKEDGAT